MTAAAVRLRAFAKVNLTLEVIARRTDGYHELRSVMQTVSLADSVIVAPSPAPRFELHAPVDWQVESGVDNLAARAERAYSPAGVYAISLAKRVPPAAGLGGGSSDAAAVLRALATLDGPAGGPRDLRAVAARLGSDVPFFLHGGTQLASGRGELLEPLQDLSEVWMVLVMPRLASGAKTARLFGQLAPRDFTTGQRSAALVDALQQREPAAAPLLYNAFDRVADGVFQGLEAIRSAVVRRCGHAVLCGAGPSLFALAGNGREATAAAKDLAAIGLPAAAARTVSAAESTACEPA